MRIRCIRLLSALIVASFTLLAQAQAQPPGYPGEEVVSRDSKGVPTFVKGALGSIGRGNQEAAATQFLREITRRTFSGAGTEDFLVTRKEVDALGQVHIKAQQRLRGLPVVGGELVVHADVETGAVHLVNGNFTPDRDLPRSPSVEAGEAVESAIREAGFGSWEILEKPSLTYVIGLDDVTYLAWAALVRHVGEEGVEVDRVFADATNGSLVARHPQIHRAKDRRTYTSNHSSTLPGTLLITEGGSSADTIAQTAHNYTGTTYDYYWSRHGRDSLNNAGMTLISSVHYVDPWSGPNNAFWTGSQMAYGDGDGVNYGPFGNGLDVVAHELTHGVTQFTTGLVYQDEPGALNEALSDIFGAATEAWARGLSANTWRLGEDVYTPGVPGDAFRYMNNPTQDGDSRDYYPTRYIGPDDWGGVHWNSGIANLAFYLLVQGGQHPRGVTSYSVTGIGLLKAERIFYRVQSALLITSNGNFEAMRNATAQAARDLYGPVEAASVHAAWCAVGVPGCPVYNGQHGGTTCGSISGWALDTTRPNEPISVDIYDGSTKRGTVTANQCMVFRCDIFSYSPSSAFKDGTYHTVRVRYANTNIDLSDTPQSLICKVSGFTSQTPAEFGDTLGRVWSVGNDFHSSISGAVTHLRYYRAAEETGLHTLQLWTSGGSLLKSVTIDFGSDLTAGWETAALSPAIAIQAGVTYVVTVTTTGPRQSKTSCGFSTPVTNGPLTFTGGRWVEGNGIFPTNGSCSNFWTDVYFDQ